ncbi:heavy-metal-associated domain-containing protein [Pedobacter faecalis]|uniref:heavy-metal-associated domain-containing protein n=1 Tax=Pedobacter faecalis TaxID=3041495 RepID=UPI00254B1E4C|nr:cation transporter [Pedobacter sp. ELA7]
MKTIQYFALIIFVLTAGKVSAQQISSAELQVTGLTCSMCSQATEKSLRTLDFVKNVEPDLNRNVFVLSFDAGKRVNLDKIADKVQDAGFSVGNLAATFNFNQVKVDPSGKALAGSEVYHFVNAKNKVLNGKVKASVVDKGFISNAEYKKKAAEVKSEAYKSGYAMVNGKRTRVYHLSI